MEELSEKESKIYSYVLECIETDGYSPSVRDIQAALGIKSTATVYSYIERLRKKGFLKKDEKVSRSYRPCNVDTAFKVPIVGKVTAGVPITAIENFDGYISFNPDNIKIDRNNLFALKVSGSSMIDAGIFDGDYVIVEKIPIAENGQIIVAMIDDSATVKTFYREKEGFRLQPENSEMQPIYTKEITVLGRVVASIRYY